ncbi:Gfo/Idh/MocA family protein [Niallia endozanthoxylica]|uniref:Inositol 2-dehydrogenase/D-chiro-inositol 3-dehydrogenase n=1 Tax=Niallia endozanthoxylica TaxID=2036016 RepID=A0A5J5H8R1_9BACI|nr:Gfo/Idh/MocA family oxidoreductase [Niallia endozanthoxylica]KAA9016960.1 Gfo/Idh/MocA family oxidoreductase [Niallia endozanthoxylica]
MELKIGVIGTGAIGQDHIRRFTNKVKGAKVVAVTDIHVERAEQIAQEVGAKFVKTGEELISLPEVDAVVVTSWDPTHEQYVLEAINHNKYVFCEKPLSVETEGCKRIVDAEVKLGKRLVQVGFMRRYDRGYMELKEIIDSGKLGEVLMLHCAHRNVSSGENYDTLMAIVNSAVHEIDVLRWLLNEDYVAAQVIMPKKTSNTHEKLHDPQVLILETESGIHIDVEIFVNCKYGYDIKCEVVCEDGVVSLSNPSYSSIRTAGKDFTGIPIDWEQRFEAAYEQELQLWVDSVTADEMNGPTAWDGYVASVTTTAGTEARETGKRVEIKIDKCPDLYK